MSESRKRMLSQLKSSIFSHSPPRQITPIYSKTRAFSSQPSPKSGNFLNSNIFPMPTTLITPKTSRPRLENTIKALPRPYEVEISVLQVSGLRPFDTEAVLKEIGQKHHIVEVNTEFDNVKGICTGKGTISIRSFPNKLDKEELVMKLENRGYEVGETGPNNSKKNLAEWFANSDQALRRDKTIGKIQVCKENFGSCTPRYMRPTTSFSNKFFK